ncbi:perlucin-like [Armigeres subalbatus]|uniref:perlucin-like n=1 Tax=Armigeres subalbatus TaxID=124917 RepID=UPI002ED686F7
MSVGWIVFLFLAFGAVAHCIVYHISRAKKTWTAAIEYCKCYGMRLAVVDTREKQKALEQALIKSPIFNKFFTSVWIGASDREREGVFVWQPTAVRIKYSKWEKGMPDNGYGGEDCVHVFSANYTSLEWLWNDWRCNGVSNIACEKIENHKKC